MIFSMRSLPVGPLTQPIFIVAVAALETVEREVAHQRMFLAARDRVCEAPAGRWRGLEPLVAPAAVEIEIVARRAPDKGTAVGRHILDACPVAQEPEPRDRGNQCDRAFGHCLDLRELAALRIGIEAVDVSAEHEAA